MSNAITNQPALSSTAFAEVLRDHANLIRLVNDLEFSLYEIGDNESETVDRKLVTPCQLAAGELIRNLRTMLFRLDQQVYPLVDPNANADVNADDR